MGGWTSKTRRHAKAGGLFGSGFCAWEDDWKLRLVHTRSIIRTEMIKFFVKSFIQISLFNRPATLVATSKKFHIDTLVLKGGKTKWGEREGICLYFRCWWIFYKIWFQEPCEVIFITCHTALMLIRTTILLWDNNISWRMGAAWRIRSWRYGPRLSITKIVVDFV